MLVFLVFGVLFCLGFFLLVVFFFWGGVVGFCFGFFFVDFFLIDQFYTDIRNIYFYCINHMRRTWKKSKIFPANKLLSLSLRAS